MSESSSNGVLFLEGGGGRETKEPNLSLVNWVCQIIFFNHSTVPSYLLTYFCNDEEMFYFGYLSHLAFDRNIHKLTEFAALEIHTFESQIVVVGYSLFSQQLNHFFMSYQLAILRFDWHLYTNKAI